MLNFCKSKKIIAIVILTFMLFLGIIFYNIKNESNFFINDIEQGIEENMNLKFNDSDEEEMIKNNNESQEVSNKSNIICIHITGEVNRKGIVELTEGQRIVDAIELAGGVTENADLNKVNLAYVLSDGQKVNIPSIYDRDDEFEYVTDESGNGVIEGKENDAKCQKKININTATQSELEQLDGVGPSLAVRIIEYRKENGKFKSIEELKNVSRDRRV